MLSNQIGAISAGKLKSSRPDRSADVDFHPGVTDGFTFGFLINGKAYDAGRSAGSLAWAGLLNTFFWIDRRPTSCATLLMQFLPFLRSRRPSDCCAISKPPYTQPNTDKSHYDQPPPIPRFHRSRTRLTAGRARRALSHRCGSHLYARNCWR